MFLIVKAAVQSADIIHLYVSGFVLVMYENVHLSKAAVKPK